jgi:hypothetical protein
MKASLAVSFGDRVSSPTVREGSRKLTPVHFSSPCLRAGYSRHPSKFHKLLINVSILSAGMACFRVPFLCESVRPRC